MNDKKIKLRPPTDEELAELFHGIIQENRDHGHIPPRRPRCNDCQHLKVNLQLQVIRCEIVYPEPIPEDILANRNPCENFKAK